MLCDIPQTDIYNKTYHHSGFLFVLYRFRRGWCNITENCCRAQLQRKLPKTVPEHDWAIRENNSAGG